MSAVFALADPMPSVTAGLAEAACSLRFDLLPADVRELARQCILDWMAVSLAGSREPLVQILVDQVRDEGAKGAASLIGWSGQVSPRQAALVNGAMSHALDYDDVNIAMLGHPTVAVLPAALALAEAQGATGAALLAAFVAGYEATCRVGQLVNPGHYNGGFHCTATVGSFGAAASSAHVLGLDARRTAFAFGIAATQAAGLKSMFGTMCKPFHAGKANENGLLAACLAQRGFDSREDALECAQGFAATQSVDFHPAAALQGPALGYHIRSNLFKYHASCYQTHATIDAARLLREAHRIAPDDISRIIVRNDSGADTVCNIQEPRTGLEAKFSLRTTVALALAEYDTAALGTFHPEIINDPTVVRLRDRITVELMPNWPVTQSEVVIELKDGRRLQDRRDSGVPSTDLEDQARRLRSKFDSLAVPVIGPVRAQRLADLIANLEDVKDVSELTQLTQP